MALFKLMSAILILSITVEFSETTTDCRVVNEDENLAVHLENILVLIHKLRRRNMEPSMEEMESSVKQARSVLLKVVDEARTPAEQRPLILETIKDMQKLENYLEDKAATIQNIERLCGLLINTDVFEGNVIDVEIVKKYLKDLKSLFLFDINKVDKEIGEIAAELSKYERNIPELHKLVDYFTIRKCLVFEILDLERYIEGLSYGVNY